MPRRKTGSSSRKGKKGPLRDTTPNRGLATVAGGWKGSPELAERLVKIVRTPPRRNSAAITVSESLHLQREED